MADLHIQFTLFSAFYAPLIVTITGDFLREEGLEATWDVAPPGVSAIEALKTGHAQVIQSAPSQAFTALDAGDTPSERHFAQINEMDGFFLSARDRDTEFSWHKLEGAEVLLFGGGQPLVMFKYACLQAGIDFDKLRVLNVGGAAAMDRAFRDGQGTYVQQQGPYPQQLETDGLGHVVAQCGPKIGPNAFSSVAATSEWLRSEHAKAFTRAYRRARDYINDTSAQEIATLLSPEFPQTAPIALANCIDSYQRLGCWSRHIEITPAALEAAQAIFATCGNLKQHHAYDRVCAPPPS